MEQQVHCKPHSVWLVSKIWRSESFHQHVHSQGDSGPCDWMWQFKCVPYTFISFVLTFIDVEIKFLSYQLLKNKSVLSQMPLLKSLKTRMIWHLILHLIKALEQNGHVIYHHHMAKHNPNTFFTIFTFKWNPFGNSAIFQTFKPHFNKKKVPFFFLLLYKLLVLLS